MENLYNGEEMNYELVGDRYLDLLNDLKPHSRVEYMELFVNILSRLNTDPIEVVKVINEIKEEQL